MKPIAFIALLSLLTMLPAQAEPPAAARQEIAHLLDYLKSSGCRFNRNGSWHDAGKAAGHLQDKVDYLVKRDLIASGEDFIARAATQSSMSGKPYQVRCGDAAPVPSATWLKAELAKYRATHRPLP